MRYWPRRTSWLYLVVCALIGACVTASSALAQQGDPGGGAQPQAMRDVPDSCQVSDQLTNVTGSFGQTQSELTLPGLGGGLSFTRSYNSPDTRTDGPLGAGWSHGYETRTQALPGTPGAVSLIRPSGRFTTFTGRQADGSYQSPRGVSDTLQEFADGGRVMREKDGTEWKFSPGGKLLSRTDSNGQAVSLDYDGSGKLQTVREPSGRQYRFSYGANNKLSAVADPAGRSTEYSYNATGQLQSVREPGGLTNSFKYDAAGRLSEMTDPDGHVSKKITYDAKGRISSQEDATGNRFQVTYEDAPSGEVRKKTVIDSTGQKVVDEFNDDGEVVVRTVSGPDGPTRTLRFAYDARGFCKTITDALDRTTSLAYDDRGNALTRTDPLGQVWRFTYDAQNNLTKRVDARGAVTDMAYDSRRNLIRKEQQLEGASKAVTTYEYDAKGLLTKTTDPNGHATTMAYDSTGDVQSATDALGRITRFTHDGLSRLTSVTDPRGIKTTVSYDAAGRANEAVEDAGGLNATRKYEYDGRGNTTASIDANGHRQTFSYDAASRLIAQTDPLNRATRFAYDLRNNPVKVTDPAGKVWESTYDGLDRLTRSKDPDGRADEFSYDLMDNLLSSKDKNGHSTGFAYDALNRVTQLTDAAGGKAGFGYDAANNVTKLTDPLGHATTFDYNLAGWLRSETDALGSRWERSYDAGGNLTRRKDAKGQTATFEYDKVNQPTKIAYADGKTVAYGYDAGGNRLQMVDSSGTTTATYDALNRATKVDQPTTGAISYGYDLGGNRTSLTLPGGRTTRMDYDAADQLAKVTDGAGRISTFAYDARGLATTKSLPGGIDRRYGYDASGRLTSLEHWKGTRRVMSEQYGLDGVGNRLTANESVACGSSDIGRNISYGYDALDRLTSATYTGATPNESYSYDAAGNRVSAKLGQQTTTYDYDAANRLTRARGPQQLLGAAAKVTVCAAGVVAQLEPSLQLLFQGDQAYRYDANGNLLQKGQTTYDYDAADQMVRSQRPSLLGGLLGGILPPETTTFAYNGDDDRVSSTANGKTNRWLNDVVADLPVILRETTTGSGSTQQVDYTWGDELLSQEAIQGSGGWRALLPDGLGSIRALTDSQGQITDTLDYDAFGNSRALNPKRASTFGFAGEPTDPTTGFSYLRARYYDPSVGRFTARDDLVQGGPGTQGFDRYTYAGNNPVNWTDPSGHLSLNDIGDAAEDVGDAAADVGRKALKSRTVRMVAAGAAATGAAAACPATAGAGCAVAAGIATGSGLAVANQAANEKDHSAKGYAKAAGAGGVEGAVAGVPGVGGGLAKAGWRGKLAIHGPHHSFGRFGRLPHVQANAWKKGVRKSGKTLFRIPFPKKWKK